MIVVPVGEEDRRELMEIGVAVKAPGRIGSGWGGGLRSQSPVRCGCTLKKSLPRPEGAAHVRPNGAPDRSPGQGVRIADDAGFQGGAWLCPGRNEGAFSVLLI